MNREGLLLVNTGTPDAPEPRAVRRYLAEFLSDPRVLDMPRLSRWLLLRLVILPRRPKRSAAAYRQVWTDRGSPLLVHGLDLVAGLRERLGAEMPVEIGMRYGSPTISGALDRLVESGADRLAVLPLFPQLSSAAWGSAVEKALAEAASRFTTIRVVPPYYDHPAFLDAFAAVARGPLTEFRPDRVLMSFHGLPVRHVRKADATGHCLRPGCCDAVVDANRSCYRAHCFATARGIAGRLDLGESEWEAAFQSRLGRAEWIGPHTDARVRAMPGEGVKRLAVLAPAFVADGLETLEEIGIRAREEFRAAGGEELRLVPSLNAEPEWVKAVASIVSAASPPT